EERPMNFDMSDKQKEWLNRVQAFMAKHVRPAVPIYKQQDAEGPRWKVIPVLEDLKKKAKAEGLWNMFMPPNAHEDDEFRGAGLTNLEYALLSEEMGHISWASEVFNCSAPDTGNMEVLMRYGTKEQKRKWLRPLMDGEIRSAFLMTEPAVASSDATNILLGEGRGFEIAQGRLGPGRIHHCMRTIGKAEEALEKMVKRLSSRTAFGKKIIEHSVWEQRIGEARTDIEMNRLLCLKAADMMDKVGNKTAQLEIAMIKVAAPNMALKIIDNAIQAFGGAGVSDDAGLARDYASMRTMRLADGPDEVHNRAIARLELRKYANSPTKH